jgi:ATP/maltotriose-dependent transcriptional regulator MalT
MVPLRPTDGRRDLIRRPRIIDRIASASSRPIVLILAPAGYGKSVAVDQYLASVDGNVERFGGSSAHRELVKWSSEALDGFAGTVAIDGLETASAEAVQSIVASIERTKSRVRWIISSRSSVGLPIGTWLAYGECDLPIGPNDFEFTVEESIESARALGLNVEAGELRDVLQITGGWPVAVSVAFRVLAGSEPHELHAAIREASQHFWSEQVYTGIGREERALLSVAAALPEIDVRVLDLAGFKNALHLVEAIRARTGLLHDETSGIYRCAPLFLEFLRYQTSLLGSAECEAVHLRAARALEKAGNIESALTSYVAARSQSHVLRLLEVNGFELLERGRSEAVSQAISGIDDATRRVSPRILALRGVLQSLAGNPVRAEVLLRRALSRSQGDPDLTASATLRLALLLTNRGADIAHLLFPISDDSMQSAARRGEALSLLAAQRALAGDPEGSKNAMSRVQMLLVNIDVDSVRAKILQRIGVAAMYIGEADEAREALVQAAELATELEMYSLASRAYANLSNLMLHRFDDVGWQLWYAEQASVAALKAGDAFDVETASLQLFDAELRCGKIERSANIEHRLAEMRATDQSRAHYLIPSKALRLAWEGQFAEAHRLLAPCWHKLHHDIDRLVSGSQCALYLAIDNKRQASLALTAEVLLLSDAISPHGPFSVRSIAMARVFCALSNAVNGRFTHAERIVRRIEDDTDDAVATVMAEVSTKFIAAIRGSSRDGFDTVSPLLERLAPLGYAHMSRLLQSAQRYLIAEKPLRNMELTRVELAILRLLSEGFTPKEIANQRARSVNTVRTHIANAISKLHCNGRGQAIALSRRMGILD